MGIEEKRKRRYMDAGTAIVLLVVIYGGLGALWLMA